MNNTIIIFILDLKELTARGVFNFTYNLPDNVGNLESQFYAIGETEFLHKFISLLQKTSYFSTNSSFKINIHSLFDILLKLLDKCFHNNIQVNIIIR